MVGRGTLGLTKQIEKVDELEWCSCATESGRLRRKIIE